MRNLGWNRKRDAIEADVVRHLEQFGWRVLRLSVRNGPDLAIARRGKTLLVEVKSGQRKLSLGQRDWHETWPGETCVIRSVDDIQAFV